MAIGVSRPRRRVQSSDIDISDLGHSLFMSMGDLHVRPSFLGICSPAAISMSSEIGTLVGRIAKTTLRLPVQ